MLGFGAISSAAISARSGSGITTLMLSARITMRARAVSSLSLPTSVLSLQARITTRSQVRPNVVQGLELSMRITARARIAPAFTAPEKLEVSKLNAYAVAAPKDAAVSVSKANAYAVARPLQGVASVSKVNSYAALRPLQGMESVSKVVAYAAVYPLVSPPNLFPALPNGFPVSAKPIFANVSGGMQTGRDMRAFQQVLPIWEFELNFEELRDRTQNAALDPEFPGFEQFVDLAQFFLSGVGQFGRFLFDAWWDNSRLDQPIGIGDGTSGNFTMVRTWGYDGLQFLEPVGAVNVITNVKINGVIQSPSVYSISNNNILTFQTAPGAGLSITSTFSYYYLCQMAENQQDYTEFFHNRWTAKIKFRSVLQR